MKGSLLKARDRGACKSVYKELLRLQGKVHADDEPIELLLILDRYGIDDALWALRVIEGHDKEIKAFFDRCVGLIPPSVPESTKREMLNNCTIHKDITGASYVAAPKDSIYHVVLSVIAVIADNEGHQKGTPEWDASAAATRSLVEADLREMLTK